MLPLCSHRHPSCSLTFKMCRLSRPFPSAASLVPLPSGVPLGGKRGGRVTKVSRLSCQHRFHVLSRVCGRLEWNTWRWQDAVCGRSTSDLLPYHFGKLVIQLHCVFFVPPLFSPVFTFYVVKYSPIYQSVKLN